MSGRARGAGLGGVPGHPVFNGSSVIIDRAENPQPGTTYQLIVSVNAVQDLTGNASAGVSGHSFTTAG